MAQVFVAEATSHGPLHAVRRDHVVEFLHDSIDLQPVVGVAGAPVNQRQAADRLEALTRQALVQRQPLEGPVLAWARDADHASPQRATLSLATDCQI